MKEFFFVARMATTDKYFKSKYQHFVFINENTPDLPPLFATSKEAEDWIKNNGEKGKYYHIQRILIPQ